MDLFDGCFLASLYLLLLSFLARIGFLVLNSDIAVIHRQAVVTSRRAVSWSVVHTPFLVRGWVHELLNLSWTGLLRHLTR